MQAVFYRGFGAAERVLTFGPLPTPEPGPGEVLVRLRASGVNPSDVNLRAGARPGAAMPYPFVVPHSDGAGEIAAVGDGVDPARLATRVWVWNAQWRRQMGTAAEYVALPAEQAVPLPEGVDWAAGACLGIPAMTAWAALFEQGPIAGQTVVVTGAAGAVGRYAVQMARLGGAEVIATASGCGAEEAGRPHHLIDRQAEDVAERVLAITKGRGADRIVEVAFGANLPATERMIAEGGTIVAYASADDRAPRLPFYPLMFRNVTLRLLLVYLLDPAVRRRGEAEIGRWLAKGALSHRVAARFPLVETAAAHRAVEAGGKRGTVVVEI